MAANAFAGDDWNAVIDVFKAGGDPADLKEMFAAKDRKLDAYFTPITKDSYRPILRQTATELAIKDDYQVEGFRVGPFIWLNTWVVCNQTSGAAGEIYLSVPPQFPPVSNSFRPVGVLVTATGSPLTVNVGMAYASTSNFIAGFADGVTTANGMGVSNPNRALTQNVDQVGFSIQYMTSAPSL